MLITLGKTIGERIRILMENKNITANKLVELTGLELKVIQNLIYNRTRKYSNLIKVAQALEVNIEYLESGKTSISLNKIDLELYFLAIELVKKITKENEINIVTYNILLEIIYLIYEESLNNKNDKIHLESFARGIIRSKLFETKNLL